MKVFSVVFVCAVLLLFCFGVAAKTPNLAITAAKVAQAPVIDGAIDDAAWLAASQIGAKTVVDLAHTSDSISQFPRVAYLAYDENAIYLAFVTYTQSPEALEVSNGTNSIAQNDEIEVFLAPPSGGYLHVIIDAAGRFNLSDDRYQYAVAKRSVQWIVEMAIPFSVFGSNPQADGDWTINLTGHQIADGATWVSWNPTYGGFHNPSRFGNLLFSE